ncbi:hypothetical protein RKD28_007057 [Streptomyces sp. SAI-229]
MPRSSCQLPYRARSPLRVREAARALRTLFSRTGDGRLEGDFRSRRPTRCSWKNPSFFGEYELCVSRPIPDCLPPPARRSPVPVARPAGVRVAVPGAARNTCRTGRRRSPVREPPGETWSHGCMSPGRRACPRRGAARRSRAATTRRTTGSDRSPEREYRRRAADPPMRPPRRPSKDVVASCGPRPVRRPRLPVRHGRRDPHDPGADVRRRPSGAPDPPDGGRAGRGRRQGRPLLDQGVRHDDHQADQHVGDPGPERSRPSTARAAGRPHAPAGEQQGIEH